RASFTRREAIFCLGAYRDPAAEAALREIAGLTNPPAGDPDIEAVCISLKSLSRIYRGLDTEDDRTEPLRQEILARIRHLLDDEPELPYRGRLDLRLAEAILDPEGPQLVTLFEDAARPESPSFATTRFMIAFRRLGFEPGLDGYLRAEVRNPDRGFEELVEDASEFAVFKAQRAQLLRWASLEEYQALWAWLSEQVSDLQTSSREEGTTTVWVERLAGSMKRYAAQIDEAGARAPTSRIVTLSGLYALHHMLAADDD
ncbi:MAG: hypothetical protein EA383_09520, partial [Spirochaetaceae bacterium]